MSDAHPFSYLAQAQAVHATLDDALASIPRGKRGALLAQAVTVDGETRESLTVAARLGDSWQLAAGAEWDGDVKHKAALSFGVMGSW